MLTSLHTLKCLQAHLCEWGSAWLRISKVKSQKQLQRHTHIYARTPGKVTADYEGSTENIRQQCNLLLTQDAFVISFASTNCLVMTETYGKSARK